jgi:hypothetical protein
MTVGKSDLSVGFRLEDPAVLVPWGASVEDLLSTFRAQGHAPRRVTASYYTAAGRLFGGTEAKIGFHFGRWESPDGLEHVELFDNGEREIEKSYQVFHRSLVEQFGEPTVREPGDLGPSMPYCEWRVGSVRILHYVMDRFGPEEHLTLRKNAGAALRGAAIATVVVSLALVLLYSWCEQRRSMATRRYPISTPLATRENPTTPGREASGI